MKLIEGISLNFGELITLIEEDKRDVIEVVLPYSKKLFTIPSNLFIIGTMNSTDKSIALIDIALRRRFTFVKMKPNDELINHPKSKELLKALNQKITEKLGEDYQIGHSYFMKIENDADFSFVIKYKIKPLLKSILWGYGWAKRCTFIIGTIRMLGAIFGDICGSVLNFIP
ncbi:hypothetical protein [Sulfurospirillum diekertiae]|uniref:hypothetical protein n=1 Tax=Sulfurospirillum diekertiae TaxID=1854492 RepID=UPI001E43D3F9|nr:hypothetical protein [Sulfurospirillum diekertiae]